MAREALGVSRRSFFPILLVTSPRQESTVQNRDSSLVVVLSFECQLQIAVGRPREILENRCLPLTGSSHSLFGKDLIQAVTQL
jgi:hypothetical protein